MNRTTSGPAVKPGPAPTVKKTDVAPRPGAPAAPAAARTSPATATAAPSSAAKPKPDESRKPAESRRAKLIALGAGAAVVITLGVLLCVRLFGTVEAPRLNSEPYVIGKFTATRDFGRLDFAKQWQYYELMDDKEDALKTAYAEGKLTDDEYRTARQAAWYGKHLGRMKNYFDKPPGRERDAYLDKQVLKKYDDDKNGKGDGKSSAATDTKSPLTADEIKRDDSEEEADVSAWPPDVRAKWDQYRAAYRARKDIYKQARDAEKARKNAPVTAPVRVPGSGG